MSRFLNILIALILLTIVSPILIFFLVIVFIFDLKNPIYFAKRVGKNFIEFEMYKIRTMIFNAESSGVNSTSDNDKRITQVGKLIRKFKIDELLQLVNVIKGDMNIVGPRPNVWKDVSLYTPVEKKILDINPGITDFSSIVFSDEGIILKNKKDPDLSYNQLIRPWKSRLCLAYIEERNLFVDLMLILLTFISIFKKKIAINIIHYFLERKNYSKELLEVVKRDAELKISSPPCELDYKSTLKKL